MKIFHSLNWITLTGATVLLLFPLNERVKAQDFEDNPDVEDTTEDVVDRNLGIDDFIEGILAQVPIVIDKSKEVIENINQGNIGNAIYGTLGVIGLIDPQEEANNTTISTDSPYSYPETIAGVNSMGKAADTQQSQTAQRLSQIIFSEEGQEIIGEQNQVLEESQEGAMLSQEATVETYESSESISNDNLEYTDAIAEEAAEARAAKASQDVLKAIASQNEYEALIVAGLSEQVALLNESQAYNAVQMKGLNTQLTVLNQREQNMQTYFAAQTLQLSEIDNNLEQQLEITRYRNAKQVSRSRVGMTKVFIPGLFTEGEEVEEGGEG